MSLRRAAFFWLAGVMSAIGLASAAASYLIVQSEVAGVLDSQLRQIALYVGDAAPPAEGTPPGMAGHDPEDDFFIRVRTADGTPIRLSDPSIAMPSGTVTGFSQALTPIDEWRVYTLVADDRTVEVAQRMTVRREFAEDAALQAALPFALLVPLSWLVLGAIIDRIMARLNRLAARVSQQDEASGAPLPVEDVPAELLPFVRSINTLLARLQAVLERQRRFLSDAAHELRTPLSAVQIQIENLRTANRDDRLAPLLSDLDGGIKRAAALVGQLLRLARYDAEDRPPAATPVDLTGLAIESLARVSPLAENRSIDLGLVRQEAAIVMAYEADLHVMIGNLLDNAIRYTPAGGTVDVSVFVDGEQATVEIRDSGPGIPVAMIGRVVERFFRAAPRDVEGSGLGLAITRAAALRNRATLELANRQDRSGLVARLTLRRARMA